MSVDLSKHSVLVIDHGVFEFLAHRLARDFGKVGNYIPWKSANMKSTQLRIGWGYDDVERVRDLWDVIDDYDIIVFPDTGDADLQVWLHEHGYKVWGNMGGEDLELHRFKLRQLMEKLGMPVLPYKHVVGLKALADHLKNPDNKDKFVKCSELRGDCETFHHIKWRLTEPWILHKMGELGPMADLMEFVVEDNLPDASEPGWDGYFVGDWPSHACIGYEIKDRGLLGAFLPCQEMSEKVTYVNDKLSKIFKSYGYQGFFSSEIRVAPDGSPYLIDPCCRLGSPPGEAMCEWFTNISNIIWEGAHGRLIDPIPIAPYAAQLIIFSDWYDKHWAPIYFPNEIENFVKLNFAACFNGQNHIVPQSFDWKKVGSVIGFGSSPQEAVERCIDNASQIEGVELDIEEGSFDDAYDQIDKGEKSGINFGTKKETDDAED